VVSVRIQEEMKRDLLGAVHRVALEADSGEVRELVLRRLDGPLWLRPLAHLLAAREQRALRACAGLPHGGPPELTPEERDALAEACGSRTLHLRRFVPGVPLHRAQRLPRDFFDHLEAAVRALHGAGVCHNDLHKEQNVVVDPEGWPRLIDFQLSSVHPARSGRAFESRCRDDLRHVQKLRRRYTKDGRGPAELGVPEERRMPRRGLALWWRRTVKPLYLAVTRGLLGTKDGEERRSSAGPWPSWEAPLGEAAEDVRGGSARGSS